MAIFLFKMAPPSLLGLLAKTKGKMTPKCSAEVVSGVPKCKQSAMETMIHVGGKLQSVNMSHSALVISSV